MIASWSTICSYPKTGRTWIRFMLAEYFSLSYDLNVDVNLLNVYTLIPNIDTNVHGRGRDSIRAELRERQKVGMQHSWSDSRFMKSNDTVVLVRGFEDTLVSHWMHARFHYQAEGRSISEFIRSADTGLPQIRLFAEYWAPRFDDPNVSFVSYEAMISRPLETFEFLLAALGVPVERQIAQQAVEKSTFERMQRIEVEEGMLGIRYDRSNPEALRVRKGIVGGFREVLSPHDCTYIAAEVAKSEELKEISSLIAGQCRMS
ncbi:sulfotransferase domain-containing protein [Williamsia muralis]|uniref:Sulfotransferase domain-containing protein n=1 Tax=Williamsia marianensis TaxID=85044 RepID=A0A2G3PIF6_WILMA|nr:sulfotransferase domain-containing protein [Williamsia marianensis]PHV65589.1 hypothetical protein CSW57_17755 [Williamsia marianensis]